MADIRRPQTRYGHACLTGASDVRIALAYIGSSVCSFGFRLLASMVREEHRDTSVHFVLAENFRKLSSILLSDASSRLSAADIDAVGAGLSTADVVGLSSFSEYATLTKDIIAAIRRHNPNAHIVWGGVHPTAQPEDCITHADSICIGEGEVALPDLLRRMRDSQAYADVGNFWFRRGSDVTRNPALPLLTNEDLDRLPHPHYGQEEYIFARGDAAFRRMTADDYADLDALSYNTVWSRGCPFKCTYCGNTRLLELDRGYGSVRHSSVDHIIGEIKAAVAQVPQVSFVVFHDDCLISLPAEVLSHFAREWRKRVGLPFAVTGVTPAHIRDEKIAILLSGGMNRVRMGIQSGSDRMLKFYKRPNRANFVADATNILGKYAKVMMPPQYDMIFDNPIETAEDVQATIRLIQSMPRPFTLNIFSLRYIPNTELGRQLAQADAEIESIETDYTSVKPTFANALMYLCAIVRIPGWLFDRLIVKARPYRESQSPYWRPVILLLRLLFFIKRATHHIRWCDFSIVFGRLGRLLKNLGFFQLVSCRPNTFMGLLPPGQGDPSEKNGAYPGLQKMKARL